MMEVLKLMMRKSDLLGTSNTNQYNSDRLPLIHLDQLPKILICKCAKCLWFDDPFLHVATFPNDGNGITGLFNLRKSVCCSDHAFKLNQWLMAMNEYERPINWLNQMKNRKKNVFSPMCSTTHECLSFIINLTFDRHIIFSFINTSATFNHKVLPPSFQLRNQSNESRHIFLLFD